MTDKDDWARLHEAIRRARAAVTPKRATFARSIGVNDSTLQILEGKRSGNVSDDMLDFVTSKLGWPVGRWRDILAEGRPLMARAVDVVPDRFEDVRLVAEALREGHAVSLNLMNLDETDTRRVVDFAAGTTFGLRGSVKQLGPRRLLITPAAQGSQYDAGDLAAQLGEVQVSVAAVAQHFAGEESQDPDDHA